MDTQTTNNAETEIRETMLPDACAVCGGDVHLRVLNGRATSYCGTCHYIAHPKLQVHHDRLELSLDSTARA